ncbi:unnamed protein product [Protopolystoma xenopodis]|uniref:Uncharacterized protein n=1 Tax=Protopolystoma xenopodis TaxID=117903 RepID=A0A3S5FGM5_9PLAT|nr:unnamed protein product [Protopolystoma xenopodis]
MKAVLESYPTPPIAVARQAIAQHVIVSTEGLITECNDNKYPQSRSGDCKEWSTPTYSLKKCPIIAYSRNFPSEAIRSTSGRQTAQEQMDEKWAQNDRDYTVLQEAV